MNGRIILTTADEGSKVQSVVCFDRKTGKQQWETDVNRGGFPKQIHDKNTHASPTAASDGERVFVVFNNNKGVQLTALDLDGKQLWQKNAGSYDPKQYRFGYAPSPLIYKNMVIVASEFDGGGFLAAYDGKSGRQAWRTSRQKISSYSSPIVASIKGTDQLLISGGLMICGYNPTNGRQLWKATNVVADATCGTVVWNGDIVYASGGYPQKQTAAVRAGSGKVLWRNKEKAYEQSMLVHDGYLYSVTDIGIAFCWDATTGAEQWQHRFRGKFSASPILANGNLYVSNERGTTFVYKASPISFQLVAQNQLGNESFASPTIVDSQILLRHASGTKGTRRETLYCIGQ